MFLKEARLYEYYERVCKIKGITPVGFYQWCKGKR